LPHRQLGPGEVSLDAVAVVLGVAGVGALQRSGFDAVRELRREVNKRTPVTKGATIYAVRREAARFVPSRVGETLLRDEQEAARPERNGGSLIVEKALSWNGVRDDTGQVRRAASA
jgi:hypothetical protein